MMSHQPAKRDQATSRTRRVVERTCAGCGKRVPKAELIRIVAGPQGQIAVDLAGHDAGRGAYVHPSASCVRKAAPAGLSKAFRTKVQCDAPCLEQLILGAAQRRARGLFKSALKSGNLVAGREQVGKEWLEGRIHLVVVAADGPLAKPPRFLRESMDAGKAVVWGTRERLGSLFDLDDVTVVGVRNASLAEALAYVCRLPDMLRAGAEVR